MRCQGAVGPLHSAVACGVAFDQEASGVPELMNCILEMAVIVPKEVGTSSKSKLPPYVMSYEDNAKVVDGNEISAGATTGHPAFSDPGTSATGVLRVLATFPVPDAVNQGSAPKTIWPP